MNKEETNPPQSIPNDLANLAEKVNVRTRLRSTTTVSTQPGSLADQTSSSNAHNSTSLSESAGLCKIGCGKVQNIYLTAVLITRILILSQVIKNAGARKNHEKKCSQSTVNGGSSISLCSDNADQSSILAAANSTVPVGNKVKCTVCGQVVYEGYLTFAH